MRSLRGIEIVRVFLFAIALLAGAATVPAPAAADTFYEPPLDITRFAPGDVIRSEALSPAPAGARAWKLLYASSGINGERIAVSGVVIVPLGASPDGGRPIVAWAHETMGIASGCAPSLRGTKVYATIPELSELISRGYIVAATDYPGLGTPGPHPYLIGRSEGQAVLDSVRAARKWSTDAGSRFAVWGHSQGGHAALFAGQIAPSYAPELTLAGVAASAPPTDLIGLIRHFTREGAGSVVPAYALVAWSQVYHLSLDNVVRAPAIPVIKRIARVCSRTMLDTYQAKINALTIRTPYVQPAASLISPWDSLEAANRPGLAPIAAPIFLAQGKLDDLVTPTATLAFARAECKLGAHVLYKPLIEVDHETAGVKSAPYAIAWIADRFAGNPAPDTCPLDSP